MNKLFLSFLIIFSSCSTWNNSDSKGDLNKADKEITQYLFPSYYAYSNELSLNMKSFWSLMDEGDRIAHLLTFDHGKIKKTIQAILFKDKHFIRMSLLTPSGFEIAALRVYPDKYVIEKLLINLSSQDEGFVMRMLSDIFLIYSEDSTLNKSIKGDVLVKNSNFRRSLVSNDRLLVDIIYDEVRNWGSDIVFKNFISQYNLVIKSLIYEKK